VTTALNKSTISIDIDQSLYRSTALVARAGGSRAPVASSIQRLFRAAQDRRLVAIGDFLHKHRTTCIGHRFLLQCFRPFIEMKR